MLSRNAANQFQEVINLSPSLPDELKIAAVNLDDPRKLSDLIASNLNISLEEKQQLLESYDVKTRLSKLTTLLNRELEVSEKIRIIEIMWQVAYADRKISAHENHIMRKVADLLYITHADYIAAKMRAKPADLK